MGFSPLTYLEIIDLLMSPSAAELLVSAGVLGYGCPVSSRAILKGIAALQPKKKAAISATFTDFISCLMILDGANT